MEIWNFIVAIFLGALIGLQREYDQQHIHLKKFAGFRTFILITFLGAILGYLGKDYNSILVIVGFIAVILMSFSSYILTYLKLKFTSATTEIAAIMSYVIGVMCTTGYAQLAVIFGILIVTFLAFKTRFHNFAKKLQEKEIFGVVKFALISLVVLPILPNKNFTPLDIPGVGNLLLGLGISESILSQIDVFNLYHIWLIIIFVAGISFLGYFLVKLVGSKKGYGLLGFVGGIISSTAVTISMADESKNNKKNLSPFILATVVATGVMFIRVIFEVSVINPYLLKILFIPMILMALTSFLLAFIFSKRKKDNKKIKEVEFKQPFALKPALKFGLFFALILLVSKVAQIMFGSVGIYVTSILSGLADVDAIVLSMSSLSKSGGVSDFVATTAITLSVMSNTLIKGAMAYFLGNKKFGKIILGLFVLILLVGGLILFL